MMGSYSALPTHQLHYLQNTPDAMFESQGDAQLRTHTQIKFLYYPLTV